MNDLQYSSLREPESCDANVHAEATKIVREVEVETKTLNEYFEKYKRLYGFTGHTLKWIPREMILR